MAGLSLLALLCLASSSVFAQYGQVRPQDMFVVHELEKASPTTGNCALPATSAPVPLSAVVDRVLCANPQSAIAWAQVKQQAANLGQSLSAYLPTISAGWNPQRARETSGGIFPSATTNSQYNTTATVSWLLYDFGQREATHEQARQLLFAANATQDSTIQQLYLQAAQDFYAVLAAQETVDDDDRSLALAHDIFDAANARFSHGIGSPGDKLQAETALRQSELQREKDVGTLRNAEGTLAVLMELDPAARLNLAHTIQEPAGLAVKDIGYLLDDAFSRRPDLAAAESNIRAAEANVRAVKASGMPSISLCVSIDHQRIPATGGISNNNTVGISVTIPIFTGFKTHYQVTQAQAQVDEKIADRDQTKAQISLAVWQAYQQLQMASKEYDTASQLAVAAESSVKVAMARYKAGVGFILDLVNAQESLQSALQQKTASLYGVAVSKFQLAEAIGILDLSATLQ